MVYSGSYDKNIEYTITKINDIIEGYIEYKPTGEECRIKFFLDKDDTCICQNVYRRVRGEARYVFLMSRESVRVKSVIEKIYMDVVGKFPKDVLILPDFCLQTRLQKRADTLSQEETVEFKSLGTWEEDNIESL